MANYQIMNLTFDNFDLEAFYYIFMSTINFYEFKTSRI